MVKKQKKTALAIFLFAAINVVIHLLVIDQLEYHRDELLYFALGLHPDFGYASVPPLIGWIAAVMQSILGYSVFAVKLFPALLGGLLVWLAAQITKELGGGPYAQVLTAVALLVTPFSLRTFHLFQPVSVDLLLWTSILYTTLRYINSKEDKYLALIGLLSGLALLNKYLVLLLLLGLIISFVLTTERSIFKKQAFYRAIGIAFLIFLPNLIWQFLHDFPVVGHMQALNQQQLVNVDRTTFMLDQINMTFASSFLLFLGAAFLFKTKKYRFLGYTVLFVFAALLLLRGKSYYTLGILPLLIAAGATFLEPYLKRKFVRWALPLGLVLITIPIIPLGLPIYGQDGLVAYFKDLEDDFGLNSARRFEDGSIHSLPQDYADQLGWEELTLLTQKAYLKIPEKEKSAIYCENYGQAGAIAIIGKKYDLPEPLSFNESFVYWSPQSFDPDIEYFIYINDELGEDVAALFENIELVGRISNTHAREYGTQVYLCTKPKSSFNDFWKEVLQRVNGNPF